MNKFKFSQAIYKDVQTDFATRASFVEGTVEIEAFDNGYAKFNITLMTGDSRVSVLCQDYEITDAGKGVTGIYLYFENEIQGEIFLFKI